MKGRKAILAVSFGTSYRDTRERTIGAIERDLREAFLECEFRRAYTSPTIRRILKERDGIVIDSVEQALERLAEDGYSHVAVQTTHVICGFEYDRMTEAVRKYEDSFDRLSWGRPLLDSPQDYEAVVQALAKELASFRKPGRNIVLMGHGTEHEANESYVKLQQTFDKAGLKDFLVGTVEASLTPESIMKLAEKRGIKDVVLVPFMVAAGDHACNDMAGDHENSWKSRFRKGGYQVECVMQGLGEYSDIRKIYVEHTRKAIERL